MAGKRSAVNCLNLEIYTKVFVGFMLIYMARISRGYTNPGDVAAINNLYAALGNPPLPGWVPTGGDPCADAWQGVQCINTDINSIILNGANLGGELGGNLGSFSSIKAIDLSNNHIGGSIPSNLPATLQNFFLSDNQFTGNIPSSLSSLSQLSAMSLNNNQLTGEIPDSFQGLTVLVNLDLSSNNLSGQLPPSLENLSSLITLHLQNNQLSGTLDVLQDLPLRDLNIENNLFSGPIPEKLLNIPNFRKDGNPFNSTIAPLPPPTSPTLPPPPPPPVPPLSGAPPSGQAAGKQAEGPSATEESNSKTRTKFLTTKRIIWISIAGVLLFIILALALLLLMPRCFRGKREADRISKLHEVAPYIGSRENTIDNEPQVQPSSQKEKVSNVAVARPKEEHQTGPRGMSLIPVPLSEQELNMGRMSAIPKRDDHEIDMGRFDIDSMPPPPPPPPPPPLPPLSTLPGKLFSSIQAAFLKKILLEAACWEVFIGHSFLMENYWLSRNWTKGLSVSRRMTSFLICNGTLQDALHSDDEFKKELSWNTRIRMALGAARALEYLHEVCEPPIVHRNFKSANVLLDDELAVRVSDCGLAPLISTGSVSQLSGQLLSAYGYGAPEFESGVYTSQSDVYSFGVVMLELLTGRKSHDRTRNRGEQFLVRWAIPQLHDIDALSRMVDPSLNGEYPAKSLSHFADIISRCVQPEPEFRPPMSEVVQDIIQMIRKECTNRSEAD
ncbi:hypothetical protein F0562_010878 [Nyssa sinensis]|uniref:Protein kinase domain-containing protein n=1 Tax=Nyssa sinensis TaxID=561372 RepID=A0A5J5A048_9ASTE|nr:hypothetical protein F0562_010878 [Nyssa sinensis]